MKTLSVYYYGIDRSCSCCYSSSDEELFMLVTELNSDQVKEMFKEYVYEQLWSMESYDPTSFLRWLNSKSHDEYLPEEPPKYMSFYMEQTGRSYCPDIWKTPTFGEEWDISVLIKPEEILGKEEWENCLKSLADNKEKRVKREEERKKEADRKAKEKAQYDAELAEYNNYVKMKDKWEGKSKPKKPKEPEKTKFEKILEDFRKKNEVSNG